MNNLLITHKQYAAAKNLIGDWIYNAEILRYYFLKHSKAADDNYCQLEELATQILYHLCHQNENFDALSSLT